MKEETVETDEDGNIATTTEEPFVVDADNTNRNS